MGKVGVLLRRRSRGTADPAPRPTAGAMCQAPFGSIFLMPTGDVRACSESFGHDLGNITQQRLPDIWHGARLAALRQAALRGDYSLGCHKCGQITEAGVPAPSRYFDNLAPDTLEPEYPKKLILSLSNSCNLRCIQCDGDLSSSIRIAEGRPRLPDVYDEVFFADLDEFLSHAEAVHFLGGEPFLVTAYHRIWDRLAVVNPGVECYVSTNATQWNARVERVLSQLRFNVEMSIDGLSKETLEGIRVGADHASVMQNIERFVEHTRARGTTAQINYCLMAQNYDEFGAMLLFAEGLDIPVQVEVVLVPSHCALEGSADFEAVRRSFQRQAEEIRPRLVRNARVFDEQFERVMSARLVVLGPLLGLPRVGEVAFGSEELAEALGRSVDELPSLHVTIGLDERIAAVSDDFAGLLGVAPDALVGDDLDALDRALADVWGARHDLATTATSEELIQQRVGYGETTVRTFVAAQRDETGWCRSVRIHIEPLA